MKIIKLLEGSEILYHYTDQRGMIGMIHTGGIRLTDLRFNGWERGITTDTHPKTDGKMYFLSMSRNRANGYATSLIKNSGRSNLIFRLCISGRSVAKYGRVYPFNYFAGSGDRSEMEDRLVSDENIIVFEDIHQVDILLPVHPTVFQKKMISELQKSVHCVFFNKRNAFISGRNSIEFHPDYDEEEFPEQDVLYGPDDFKLASALIGWLNGDKTSEVESNIRKVDIVNLMNVFTTNTVIGNKIRFALKAHGAKDYADISELQNKISNL